MNGLYDVSNLRYDVPERRDGDYLTDQRDDHQP